MAASMIATFRSYQELLITQSQCFISRTREGESRASMGTGTARGSRWAAANASAFGSLLPAMPSRSTPGLGRRGGTVDWAIAPYPPRMSTSKGHQVRRKTGPHYSFSHEDSGVRDSRRPQEAGTCKDKGHARREGGPISEEGGHEASEQGPEDRPETLDRVEGSQGPRPCAFRRQVGHERAARDVDHGPTCADARVERHDKSQTRQVAESHEPQEEERAEEDGPSDASVQLHRPAPA